MQNILKVLASDAPLKLPRRTGFLMIAFDCSVARRLRDIHWKCCTVSLFMFGVRDITPVDVWVGACKGVGELL